MHNRNEDRRTIAAIDRVIWVSVSVLVVIGLWFLYQDWLGAQKWSWCDEKGGALFKDATGEWWCLATEGSRIPGPWETES